MAMRALQPWLLFLAILALLHGQALPGAAQESRAEQLFNKGLAYHFGKGVEPSEEEALKYYLQALKLDPDYFNALYSAGFIYYGRGDYTRARKYFGQAINSARGKSPRNEAMAASAYGSCFHKEGKFKEAEKWFRAAVRKDPSLAEAHANLINLYLAQDRREEAKKAIEIAQKAAPNPVFKKLEARIAGSEGWGLATPLGMKAVGIGLGGGLIALLLLRHWRQRRRQ